MHDYLCFAFGAYEAEIGSEPVTNGSSAKLEQLLLYFNLGE